MSEGFLKVEDPDMSGSYTAKDYLSWQLDELVELIRGKIYKMSPAPSSNHQDISIQFLDQMLDYFRNKECSIFHAPFDVYFVHEGEHYKESKNIVEPDLCVICNASKIKKFGCVGAPDLLVEILSPSTLTKDRKLKFELYEEFGVLEYWIVSLTNHSVTIHLLENKKYKTLKPLTSKEKLESKFFPGLEIELKKVFRNVTGNED